MTEFNLRHVAAQVLHESTSPDPTVMADDLLERIPREQYREALLVMCREYMRQIIGEQRRSQNGGAPTGSKRVAAAREAWKRLLDTPEYLPSVGRWVFLRDATFEEVLEMARARGLKARELADAEVKYKRIAEEMRRTGAERPGDLPGEFFEQVFGE